MKKKVKADKNAVASPPEAKTLPSNLQATVFGEIVQTISRPITKLPIHKDIPRFAKNFTVFDCTNEEVCVFDGAKFVNNSLPATISALLSGLVGVLDNDKSEDIKVQVGKRLSDDSNTDLTTTMQELIAAIDDVDSPNLATLLVLRCCNQSAVAPAVVNVQLGLGSKFPIADCSWTIQIYIMPCHVVVQHSRSELIKLPGLTGTASFKWRTRMILTRSDYSLVSVSVNVTSADIDDAAVLQDFKAYVKPIYEPKVIDDVRSIFKRKWDSLPIAKDLFRFATNSVLQFDNEETVISELDKDPLIQLKHLLVKLSEKFNPSLTKLISKNWDEQIVKRRDSDVHLLMKSFLYDTLELGRLLKLLTQSILSPVATVMQLELAKHFPIKDGGDWGITVAAKGKKVTVSHIKSDVTMVKDDPEKSFSILWRADYQLDVHILKIKAVKVSTVSITFPPKAKEEVKKRTESLVLSILKTM